jgi:hypothetical protein
MEGEETCSSGSGPAEPCGREGATPLNFRDFPELALWPLVLLLVAVSVCNAIRANRRSYEVRASARLQEQLRQETRNLEEERDAATTFR